MILVFIKDLLFGSNKVLYKEKERSTSDEVIGANLKYVMLLLVKSSGISKSTSFFSPFQLYLLIDQTLTKYFVQFQ
ncbi:Uncharacterized protein FWK35_00027704, partial [Aphis craccivora]